MKTRRIVSCLRNLSKRKKEEAEEILHIIGFGRKYIESSWNSVNEKIKEKVRNYYNEEFCNSKKNRGLYIHGKTGCGKTCLMYLIARQLLMDFAYVPVFYSSIRLFDMLRSVNDNEIDLQNARSSVLFIDDLGTEYDSKFTLAKFTDLIEYRYTNYIPTFITANASIDDIREWEGYERLADRIGDKDWMQRLLYLGNSRR